MSTGIFRPVSTISRHDCQICGFALGTTFRDRADWVRRFPFHPDTDRSGNSRWTRTSLASESNFKIVLRIVVGGEVRWTALHFFSTRDPAGTPIRWTGSIDDITEQKRAEEALRRSEESYALAVAGSDDGVWDIDFVSRRAFFSARARALAGLPPGSQLIPLEEFLDGLPIHPEDMPRRRAAVEAHLSGEAPAYEGEFRMRQLDGHYRWRRIHGLCVRDADGNPHRMAGSISDVDVRHRTEEALRLSEERTSLALEASEEGHFDLDVVTDNLFISDRMCDILGYPPGTRSWKGDDFMSQYPSTAMTSRLTTPWSGRPWRKGGQITMSSSSASCGPWVKCGGSGRAPRSRATPKAMRCGARAWRGISRRRNSGRRRCAPWSRNCVAHSAWRRSAPSPAASRTTSTTSSARSSATARWRCSKRAAGTRCAATSTAS